MFLDDIVGPMGIEEAKKLSGADKFRKTISDIETKHKPGEEHYNRLKSDPAYREQEFQKWQKEVHGDKQVEEGDLMRAAWEKSKQSMPVGHKPGWALDPKTKQELLRRQTVQQRRGVDEAELWTSDKNNWGGEDPWSTGHNEWESGTDNAWSDGNQWASEGVGPESNPADSASAIPGTPGLDTGIIEDRLHVGDPVIVTAPNAYEGKTGEIAEFSPSGKFVIVNLYNYGEQSMHLSDVEYNQYADDEDADEYGEYEDEQGVAEAGPNAPYTPSPAKPFRNPKGFNKQGTGVGNKLADLNRKEWEEKKKKEQGVAETFTPNRGQPTTKDELYQYHIQQAKATKGRAKELHLQHAAKYKSKDSDIPGIDIDPTKDSTYVGEQGVAEGSQNFNKREPYYVCLAGKPIKKFDYYADARRFHDNWYRKLCNQGEQEKADKITLMPIMGEDTASLGIGGSYGTGGGSGAAATTSPENNTSPIGSGADDVKEATKKLSGADRFRKTIGDIENKYKPSEEHYNRLKSDPEYREREFQKWQKKVHGNQYTTEDITESYLLQMKRAGYDIL